MTSETRQARSRSKRKTPLPKTSRGMRTRAALLAAARTEFEEEGFAAAGVLGITRRATVSNGTFYFYFRGKEEVFLAVVQEVLDEMADASRQTPPVEGPAGVVAAEQMRATNNLFIDQYQQNSRFIRVLEEAANLNDRVRKVYRDVRRRQIARAAQTFSDLQAAGFIDPEVDVEVMANVFGSMVYNAAYVLSFLDEDVDREAIEECIHLVQTRALQLKRRPSRPASGRR